MNNKPDFKTFLLENKFTCDEFVDLKKKTWIKRGGIASIWVQPCYNDDFVKIISWLQTNRVFFEIVGGTSNCYFVNEYSPEIVISTTMLNQFHENWNQIVCECGVNMVKLAKYCNHNGIAGFEGFIGLPGTVGGAAVNNAGCYGSLASNLIESVEIVIDGKVEILRNEDLKYTHRSSALKRKEINGVLTRVFFKAARGYDSAILKKKASEFQVHRNTFQEHESPNLGTVFCSLQLKPLPLIKKAALKIYSKIVQLSTNDSVILKYKKMVFMLKLLRAGPFISYISKYGIQCFTWKDEDADLAFFQYLDFVKKNAIKAEVEIEIKGRSI